MKQVIDPVKFSRACVTPALALSEPQGDGRRLCSMSRAFGDPGLKYTTKLTSVF